MTCELDDPNRTAVLLEPQPLCQTAIAGLLSKLEIGVVGAATGVAAARALLQEHGPDLLVAEVDVPEGPEEALRLIGEGRRENPRLKVIVLSGANDRSLIDAALDAGAVAYVLKTSEPEAITTAVRQAFEPSLYLARPQVELDVSTAVAQPGLLPKLTRRELEILQLVSEGHSNRQVGKILWVTDQTVKFHLANVYRKLGVRSRFDAARWAQENGVLQVAESGEVVKLAEGNGNGNGQAEGLLVSLRPLVAGGNGATGRAGEASR